MTCLLYQLLALCCPFLYGREECGWKSRCFFFDTLVVVFFFFVDGSNTCYILCAHSFFFNLLLSSYQFAVATATLYCTYTLTIRLLWHVSVFFFVLSPFFLVSLN